MEVCASPRLDSQPEDASYTGSHFVSEFVTHVVSGLTTYSFEIIIFLLQLYHVMNLLFLVLVA